MKREKKDKLRLDQLKVHSFSTNLNKMTGGDYVTEVKICQGRQISDPPFAC